MSYIRFGEAGSDVYVYPDIKGSICCCGCPLADTPWGSINFSTTADALEHLRLHRAQGHCVPDRAFERLEADGEIRMIETLRQIADAEGGEMFMGWPDRWWADAHWRCEQGHVSTSVLRSEALGRDACLACRSPLTLTFPEDRDGPLCQR